MSIHLNAFPLEIPDTTLGVCVISYDKERLDALRASHHVTHAFRRQGESILVFRMESDDPGIRMPELGRQLAHKEGLEIIKNWIRKMGG